MASMVTQFTQLSRCLNSIVRPTNPKKNNNRSTNVTRNLDLWWFNGDLIWLLVSTPLKNDGLSNSWDNFLPWMESHIWLMMMVTSSTAQGGGGSFKNRKPIGEACCCGAKMAERTHWWIERWLCVSAFLSAVARTKQAAATPWGRHVGGMGRVTFLHVFLYFWRHDGAR